MSDQKPHLKPAPASATPNQTEQRDIADMLFDVQFLINATAARVNEMMMDEKDMVSTDACCEICRLLRMASREIESIANREFDAGE